MKYFYSAQTNGFYIDELHSPESIPSDAKEITEERYDEIFRIHSNELKMITSDSSGNPILVDMPAPPLSLLEEDTRNERNNRLKDSDIFVILAYEAGNPVDSKYKTYRQALRDLTKQVNFPTNVVWPKLPD